MPSRSRSRGRSRRSCRRAGRPPPGTAWSAAPSSRTASSLDGLPQPSRLRGSRPVVGSSRNSTAGSTTRLPPGRAADACHPSTSSTRRSPASLSSNRSSSSAARARAAARDMAVSRPNISRFSEPVRFSSTAAYWPASPIWHAPWRPRARRRTRPPSPCPVGLQQGREDPHGSGLAGAVGPEHAEHAAGRCRETHVAERPNRTVSLLKPLDFDRAIGHLPKLVAPRRMLCYGSTITGNGAHDRRLRKALAS